MEMSRFEQLRFWFGWVLLRVRSEPDPNGDDEHGNGEHLASRPSGASHVLRERLGVRPVELTPTVGDPQPQQEQGRGANAQKDFVHSDVHLHEQR